MGGRVRQVGRTTVLVLLYAASTSAFVTTGLPAGAPSLRQACPTARGVRALRAQFQLPNFNFGGGGGGGESSQQAGNAAMKQQLLDMCAAARQGIDDLDSGPSAEFEALVEALIAANPTPKPAESSLMSGRWKMAWTTEKEILFCVEKGLFGLPCTDVYQTIDSSAGTLKNVIEFTDQGFLKVDSNFKDQQGARFNFKFQ